MPYTKKNRVLLRSTYKKGRESKISVGPHGHVRCSIDLGHVYLSSLPDDLLIEGCDWIGALAIYNFLPASHKSITNGSDCYFMMAGTEGEINRGNALFIVLFHHIYNIYLLNEPFICPPFRTTIQNKYEFLQKIFIDSSARFDESVLLNIQTVLKQKTYSCWADFIKLFINPWSKQVEEVKHSTEDRLAELKKICRNADEVLVFLMSPIDTCEKIIMELDLIPDAAKEGLCNILLEKIDHHIIFLQTGVKPITIDWIRELDLFLFL